MIQWFDLAIQVFTFLAVAAMVHLTQRAVAAQLAVRRRLGRQDVSVAQAEGSVLRADKVSNPFLLWVQSATAGGQAKETQKLRKDLSLAGFDQPSAPIWYVIIRFSLAIGLPMLLIGGLGLAGRPLTGLAAFMFPLVLCGTGLIAPKAILDNRINARREQLEHEFPDALDLMVVCVEAGLGLEAAFIRVALEVKEFAPAHRRGVRPPVGRAERRARARRGAAGAGRTGERRQHPVVRGAADPDGPAGGQHRPEPADLLR